MSGAIVNDQKEKKEVDREQGRSSMTKGEKKLIESDRGDHQRPEETKEVDREQGRSSMTNGEEGS